MGGYVLCENSWADQDLMTAQDQAIGDDGRIADLNQDANTTKFEAIYDFGQTLDSVAKLSPGLSNPSNYPIA